MGKHTGTLGDRVTAYPLLKMGNFGPCETQANIIMAAVETATLPETVLGWLVANMPVTVLFSALSSDFNKAALRPIDWEKKRRNAHCLKIFVDGLPRTAKGPVIVNRYNSSFGDERKQML